MHTTSFSIEKSDIKMIYSNPEQNRMNTESSKFISPWAEAT